MASEIDHSGIVNRQFGETKKNTKGNGSENRVQNKTLFAEKHMFNNSFFFLIVNHCGGLILGITTTFTLAAGPPPNRAILISQ